MTRRNALPARRAGRDRGPDPHVPARRGGRAGPAVRGRIPLHLGGFTHRALRRAARFGDGYFGNVEIVELFHDELRRVGRDPGDVAIRIQGLFDVVAKNPEQAMAELAPYFLHVNNSYGQWHDEDRAATGLDAATALEPMTLDDFVASGTLRIHTPEEAVAMFTAMLEKAPVEHFTMMLPPGLPPARFTEYAQVFATEVVPAFR